MIFPIKLVVPGFDVPFNPSNKPFNAGRVFSETPDARPTGALISAASLQSKLVDRRRMEAGVGFAGNGHKKPCFFCPKNIGVSEIIRLSCKYSETLLNIGVSLSLNVFNLGVSSNSSLKSLINYANIFLDLFSQ